jgi:CheY-like chemotaxis protein
MTVWIVEDNAGVRRLLRLALLIIASDVWECEDGGEALEPYGVHRPDIVLMDIRMPRMNGLTATRQSGASILAPELSWSRTMTTTMYAAKPKLQEPLAMCSNRISL